MPLPFLIPLVPAVGTGFWWLYVIISTAIVMTSFQKKRRDAERALSEKNITITRSDRPKVNIPTYFWLF